MAGNTQFMITSLAGDVDGDGKVTDADQVKIEERLGDPVDETTVRLDLDLDGLITMSDTFVVQDNLGDSVICPGAFPTVPWYEDFDDYDPGSSLHGGCGWKGWDDDPAFDAPVSGAESRSRAGGRDRG